MKKKFGSSRVSCRKKKKHISLIQSNAKIPSNFSDKVIERIISTKINKFIISYSKNKAKLKRKHKTGKIKKFDFL